MTIKIVRVQKTKDIHLNIPRIPGTKKTNSKSKRTNKATKEKKEDPKSTPLCNLSKPASKTVSWESP